MTIFHEDKPTNLINSMKLILNIKSIDYKDESNVLGSYVKENAWEVLRELIWLKIVLILVLLSH